MFKVGDKVMCIKDIGLNYVGDVFIVTYSDKDRFSLIDVRFPYEHPYNRDYRRIGHYILLSPLMAELF